MSLTMDQITHISDRHVHLTTCKVVYSKAMLLNIKATTLLVFFGLFILVTASSTGEKGEKGSQSSFQRKKHRSAWGSSPTTQKEHELLGDVGRSANNQPLLKAIYETSLVHNKGKQAQHSKD